MMTSICRKPCLIGFFIVRFFLILSIAYQGWITILMSDAFAAAKDPDKLVQEAGYTDMADAVQFVKNLPRGKNGHALAASVTNEGHWHLMNASGERATVSGAVELKQALKWLLPERLQQDPSLISFFISDVSLIKNPKYLDVLPVNANLRIVREGRDYGIISKNKGLCKRSILCGYAIIFRLHLMT